MLRNPSWSITPMLLLPLALLQQSGRAQETPPASAERTVEVNALAFHKNSDGVEWGSVYPTQITVGGRPDGKPRIGFVESDVSATGAQWRSAGWSAAINAAQLTDFDPRAMQVTYAFEGRLDGPSAGALLTVGVLAAVRGDTPRADAAMTGSINPDGTIGPVGGIQHKIAGAAAMGKKLVLIPSDSRILRDEKAQEDIDLVEHGRKLGVEVVQVSDIYTAYHLMTGKELPRPELSQNLKIKREAAELEKIKFKFWMDHYKSALAKIADLAQQPGGADEEGDEDHGAIELLNGSEELARRGQKLLNEGEFTAAYSDALFASVGAYMAMERARCRYAFRNGGLEQMIARIRNNRWLTSELDLVGGMLRAKPPRTCDELNSYIEACNAYIEALAYQALAEEQLAAIPADDEDRAFELGIAAAQNQIIAWLDVLVTRDSLDFMALETGPAIPADAPVLWIADFFRRGARANHAVFESLVIEPIANAAGTANAMMRLMLDRKDERCAIARLLQDKVAGRIATHFADGPARPYAELALAISMYELEASLLAKYYSLSARLDERMEISEVKSEGTLNSWLEFSEDQTRRNLNSLHQQGVMPTASLQLCSLAHIMRHRKLDDKLDALGHLWEANLNAAAIRYLLSATQAAKK